jgi:hypothetical protein
MQIKKLKNIIEDLLVNVVLEKKLKKNTNLKRQLAFRAFSIENGLKKILS